MQKYCKFLEMFIIVMFFPSLIYAWTKNNPPITPPPTLEHDCAHWIEYNGFKLDDYPFNRNKAKNRDSSLDKAASTWAAAYAFKIGGLEDMDGILPNDFCNSFDGNNSVPMKFMAVEKDEKFCNGWIEFYGFKDIIFKENFDYIFNIDSSQLKHVSIWAYSYYIYLSSCKEDERLSPWEFCITLLCRGNANLKPFISKEDSLTCMDWLKQYDYLVYKTIWHVAIQAKYMIKNKLKYPKLHLHYFATTYGKELLEFEKSGQPLYEFTQIKFCEKYDGEGDHPQKYPFDYSGEEAGEYSGEQLYSEEDSDDDLKEE